MDKGVNVNTHPARTRRFPLRRTLTTAGLCAAFGLLAACQQTEPGTGQPVDGDGETSAASTALDRVLETGTVDVGFANERPYAYREGGELVGQAPSVHEYIFDQIGGEDLELEPHLFDFQSLIPSLNSERVDVITAGMFITPERCEQAAFSNPVYVGTTALLVESGNPLNLSDFSSVAENDEAVLAVMSGAVEVEQAKGNDVPQDRLQIVPDQQSGLDAVQSGRADAFALTAISLRALAEGNDRVEVAEAFVPVIDGEEQLGAGAAVFRQGDDELREAFNEELAKLIESDKWLELVEPYGFTEAERPDPGLTAEQLCQA